MTGKSTATNTIFAFITAQNCELIAQEIFGSKFLSFTRAVFIELITSVLR